MGCLIRGVNFLGDWYPSACYDSGRGNQVMGGVHSGRVGSILLYIGGAAHYTAGEWTKLGYIERVLPPDSPHYGKTKCFLVWFPLFFSLFAIARGWLKLNLKVYDTISCLKKNLITHLTHSSGCWLELNHNIWLYYDLRYFLFTSLLKVL